MAVAWLGRTWRMWRAAAGEPRFWLIAAPMVGPLALFVVLRLNPQIDVQVNVPVHHFYVVTAATALAAMLAAAVLRSALRLRHTPTFFLGLAFLSVSGFFLVHGLATPGVFRGPNPLVSVSAWASLLTGGLFVALSLWCEDTRCSRWLSRHMPRAVGLAVAALAAYGAIGLALTPPLTAAFAGVGHASHGAPAAAVDAHGDTAAGGGFPAAEWASAYGEAPVPPQSSPATPGAQQQAAAAPSPGASPWPWLWAVLGIGCYLAAAAGYWRRYLQTELPLAGALAVSSALFVPAVASMQLGTVWHLSWWLYHVLMLGGFAVGCGALLWEAHRGRRLHRVIEGMYLLRNEVDLELEYTDTIAAMAAATEAKDPVTKGHTVRVARVAARLGRELALPPARVRVLARAGLLHDVGKLKIPDAILKKPGPLTEEEFAIMKQHPLLGHEMLREVGTLEDEIALLVLHHERLDGSGYPFGLKGNQIPLEARILAVADFYDSLRADRPYRKALDWPVVLEMARQAAGRHLDPDCVDVLCRIVEAEYAQAEPTADPEFGLLLPPHLQHPLPDYQKAA